MYNINVEIFKMQFFSYELSNNAKDGSINSYIKSISVTMNIKPFNCIF
jgi:hypothetical protein